MKWKRPPHGGKYKLVATKKFKSDIGLVVLMEINKGIQQREYSWLNVPHLHDEGLKTYLLSLQEGIECGWYDLEILDKEIDEKS